MNITSVTSWTPFPSASRRLQAARTPAPANCQKRKYSASEMSQRFRCRSHRPRRKALPSTRGLATRRTEYQGNGSSCSS